MSTVAEAIQRELGTVAEERSRRAADPLLDSNVRAVKAFQHRRFEHTYADLLGERRYANAARFFLDELYGPHDFAERDAQFSRIVPALVRLFPKEIVATVSALAELHALSESLDSSMAEHLSSTPLDPGSYKRAWQATGQRAQRWRQIDLMLQVGRSLEHYTRNPFLRHSLRLMRRPANAAGLGALQKMLETGFDTFREMHGASHFLQTIADRERLLAEQLFQPTE